MAAELARNCSAPDVWCDTSFLYQHPNTYVTLAHNLCRCTLLAPRWNGSVRRDTHPSPTKRRREDNDHNAAPYTAGLLALAPPAGDSPVLAEIYSRLQQVRTALQGRLWPWRVGQSWEVGAAYARHVASSNGDGGFWCDNWPFEASMCDTCQYDELTWEEGSLIKTFADRAALDAYVGARSLSADEMCMRR